jgi:ABC-type phosphate/phosphonate transport system ATPase subunit
MAELLGIVGNSGSGKTTSLRNLDPTKTMVISTTGKPFSWKNWKRDYKKLHKDPETGKWEGNYYVTSNVNNIATVLKIVNQQRTEIQTVVLDDMQYLMSFETMERAKETGYK